MEVNGGVEGVSYLCLGRKGETETNDGLKRR